MWLKYLKTLKGLYIPVLILIIWCIGSNYKLWNSYILPSPDQTFQTGQKLIEKGILFKHVSVSLYRIFTGFFIAFLVAFPLGIVIGMRTKLLDYFEPILEFLRHIPPLAIIPMLILWFGIGETPKLIIIVLASFFPIFLNVLNGVLYCDGKLLEVGKSFGFSPGEQFLRIILPATLPYIITGMRLGLGYSWRALIGAELIAATAGIGYMILDAEQLSRPDIIIVGVLTIGILGSAIDLIFFKIANCLIPWKGGEKSQDGWG
ncbi:MAG: ABC transporter permease [Desulfotomaculaceae bacterium]|nr:ABC transporter permease [Desulfotomaculaceae bacterium]